MRILTLCYEFPPIGGGGSGVAKGLADQLVSMGHSVDVVTMGFAGLPREETVQGVRVHRVDCDRASESKCTAREAMRYILRARGVVRGLLSQGNYDLVHVHFILPDGYIALKEVVPRGVPLVVTAHGSDVPGYNRKLFFRIAHPLLTLVWRRITGRAAAIISPSQTLKTLIEAVRPGTEVIVIPNGIATDKYRPQEKKQQIFVATRLVERKGVQYLLRALAGRESNWPTIVVGSGEYQAELRELNEALGSPANLIGWLDNSSTAFRDFLEQSAIYVLPSDFENFPVSLLEAMAAGCAIITTRGHGCEEVVGDGAELVTPGSQNPSLCVEELRAALDRLVSDSTYCAELGARARRRLEQQFSWNAVAQRYLEVFERHRSAP